MPGGADQQQQTDEQGTGGKAAVPQRRKSKSRQKSSAAQHAASVSPVELPPPLSPTGEPACDAEPAARSPHCHAYCSRLPGQFATQAHALLIADMRQKADERHRRRLTWFHKEIKQSRRRVECYSMSVDADRLCGPFIEVTRKEAELDPEFARVHALLKRCGKGAGSPAEFALLQCKCSTIGAPAMDGWLVRLHGGALTVQLEEHRAALYSELLAAAADLRLVDGPPINVPGPVPGDADEYRWRLFQHIYPRRPTVRVMSWNMKMASSHDGQVPPQVLGVWIDAVARVVELGDAVEPRVASCELRSVRGRLTELRRAKGGARERGADARNVHLLVLGDYNLDAREMTRFGEHVRPLQVPQLNVHAVDGDPCAAASGAVPCVGAGPFARVGGDEAAAYTVVPPRELEGTRHFLSDHFPVYADFYTDAPTAGAAEARLLELEGYDDVDTLRKAGDDDLEGIGMGKGHIRRFRSALSE
eukprot:gene38682-18652_t